MDENMDPREGRVIGRIPADTFGHRLMLSRSDAGGLTIEQAATKCGLLAQSWGNWERGRHPRDLIDVVEAIADGLNIDRDWLLHGGALTRTTRTRTGTRATYFRGSTQLGPRRPRRVDGARAA